MIHRTRICALISRVVCSLALFVAATTLHAQKKMVEEPDTVALFRGLAVSVDLVGPAQLLLSDYGQYEASLRVNLKDKYFPVFELGYGKADAEDVTTQVSYKTSAPYARAGIDFNVLKNKHDIYRAYVGFRYAFTTFKYDIYSPDVVDPVWGDHGQWGVTGISSNYHWLEGAFTIDAKIWGVVRMGWSFRYKRRVASKKTQYGNLWYVPGYGKKGNTRLGGLFNITIEI